MQSIESRFGRSELAADAAVLSVHSDTEEITLTARLLEGELALQIQYGQKQFFSGSADELRAMMEAMQAMKALKGSTDLSAIWYYINQ